jgi:hypothetical protein
MALLYGRAGRLNAQNGGSRPGQKWQFLPYLERGLLEYARLDIGNVGGFTEAMKVGPRPGAPRPPRRRSDSAAGGSAVIASTDCHARASCTRNAHSSTTMLTSPISRRTVCLVIASDLFAFPID